MDHLRKAVADGVRIYYRAALWCNEMAQDQMQRYWNMLQEQNGKIRNEMEAQMEALVSTWATNMKRGREELQRNLEKSLGLIEESATRGNGDLWPLAAVFKPWMDMQEEIVRNWMGIWGFPPALASPKSGKEGAGEAPARSK